MWSVLRALAILYVPSSDDVEGDPVAVPLPTEWFEEELEHDLKWSMALNGVLHRGTTEYQVVDLIDTKRFGKVLVTDGKLQSAEKDEFVYHESLVHPALLIHDEPRSVFIMGGGEGSCAREVLKHKDIEHVVMCDIDKDVVHFCWEHLTENREAFDDPRLQIVFNDAKEELQKSKHKFDVIVGDLCDPMEGGPSCKLYSRPFYEDVIKTKLNHKGIFVTQAGPAGILSHKDVFAPIYNTLRQVFTHVIAYIGHVPSYADECGWVLASDHPIRLDEEQLERRIAERIREELRYLDGSYIVASTVLNKTVTTSLKNETAVITEENARFIHGLGLRRTA